MKKIAYVGFVACLLASATAFAYTNEYAGYSINNKEPDFVMEGPKLYGYMNLNDKNVHAVNYFFGQELQACLAKPFTTAYFDDSYAKLAVMDKNALDKSLLNLPLLNLNNYAQLNASTKAILESNLQKQFQENIKPVIRLDKIGSQKVITLNLCYKQNGELVNTYVSLLSQNDVLYMLTSGSMPEGFNMKKASAAEQLNPKFEAMDISKLDQNLVKKMWNEHASYVKSVKLTKPNSANQPQITFKDVIAQKEIKLPQDWAYAQYNHRDKKNPGILSVALPVQTLAAIGEKWSDDGVTALKDNGLSQSELSKKLGEEALSCVDQLFISGTMDLAHDKDVADMLANPLIMKLQAEVFIKEGLKRLKDMSGPNLTLNDYDYTTDFATNKGKIDVNFDYTVFTKYDFLTSLRLTGTNEKASGLLFITKKGFTPDAAMQNNFNEWSF